MSRVLIGIFVGGSGTRMGGVPKGLLGAPEGGETLIERLLRVCAEAAPDAKVCLVGRATAYAQSKVPALEDAPSGVGPLGGLCALLQEAERRGAALALALACDLPFLDASALRRLLQATSYAARVPRSRGRLQPLAAAYAPGPTLQAVDAALREGKHALMHVLERLGDQLEVIDFSGTTARALEDWDEPEDLTRAH